MCDHEERRALPLGRGIYGLHQHAGHVAVVVGVHTPAYGCRSIMRGNSTGL